MYTSSSVATFPTLSIPAHQLRSRPTPHLPRLALHLLGVAILEAFGCMHWHVTLI